MCQICANGFSDSNFNQGVIDKISIFHKFAPNFTYSHTKKALLYKISLDAKYFALWP